MINFKTSDLLDPSVLKPYMFQSKITGEMNFMIPYKQNMTKDGDIVFEYY